MEKVMFNKHLTPTQNEDVGAMELNKIQLFTLEVGKVSGDNTHDLTIFEEDQMSKKLFYRAPSILLPTRHMMDFREV